MGNLFCNNLIEDYTTYIINEENIVFYLYTGINSNDLTADDIIGVQTGNGSSNLVKIIVRLDGHSSFEELARCEISKYSPIDSALATFKIVGYYQDDKEVDSTKFRQDGKETTEIREKLNQYGKRYNSQLLFSLPIIVGIISWTLDNDHFEWLRLCKNRESYYDYKTIDESIANRNTRSLLKWAWNNDYGYNEKCHKLLNGKGGQEYIDIIYEMIFTMYYAHKVWVIPTLKSIHFILHLMNIYKVSDILAVGVGHGLVENILSNEAHKQGRPIHIYASDSMVELYHCTPTGIYTDHPGIIVSKTGNSYRSNYFGGDIHCKTAYTAICDYKHQIPEGTKTIFITWSRGREFTVDILEELQEWYRDYTIVIAAYTTGEECTETIHKCEPKEFYTLLSEYKYRIKKYSGNSTVLFSHPKMEELSEQNPKMEELSEQNYFAVGCKDYLLILQREPIVISANEED